MNQNIINTIKDTLYHDERIIFAYLYGNTSKGDNYRDIDISNQYTNYI